MRLLWIAASLCLLAAAKPVAPVAPPSPPAPGAGARSYAPAALLFAGFDTGGDAQLDRQELAAGVARMWQAADPQREGSIGLIALGDWAQVWLGDQSAPPGRFDFDRNGDDRISGAEFKAEFDRQFAKFDADKSGSVTRAEMLQAAPIPNFRQDGRQVEQRRGPGR